MKKRQIDLFFRVLDKELSINAEVILLGAAAGSLMGHVRPSLDIDFEIRLKKADGDLKARLMRAIQKASEITGIETNFSENVSRWSRIHFLDYRKTAISYKKIGKLTIKIMAPEYWTLGKMARFLELDIQDMIEIIRAKKIKPEKLIHLWARSVRSSDLSLELGQFRDHVLFFLNRYGKKLWGRAFDLDKNIGAFKRQVGHNANTETFLR